MFYGEFVDPTPEFPAEVDFSGGDDQCAYDTGIDRVVRVGDEYFDELHFAGLPAGVELSPSGWLIQKAA